MHPRLTVRTRLTLLYGGLFLLAGGILIAIFYVLFRTKYPGSNILDHKESLDGRGAALLARRVGLLGSVRELIDDRRAAALHDLLWQCLVAFAGVAVVALGLGWWTAGRALRPVHDITATARRVAASNLHERLALTGPRDELTDLANTFDAMLERLDASFDSQRRFVANASHELRTPLATSRTLLEVALAQDDPPLRDTLESLLATNKRNEQLIDGLLMLARSENRDLPRVRVDLSDVAAGAVEETAHEAGAAGIRVDVVLDPAAAAGDPVLLERLALNLVRNAINHNHPGGRVAVSTRLLPSGQAELTVLNTGSVIAADQIDALYEPFHRLPGSRTDHAGGVGLGLSIVRTIVTTHGGTITAVPRRGGGLVVTVHLPVDDHGAVKPVPTGSSTP
ncbi:MAG TPA: HAMP domain-containing sensor histidine kinase [Mycobacteriales bacterium]|nr:HAMP domain-containing sensor histidine kinase [Mycobacteriales bacterium]